MPFPPPGDLPDPGIELVSLSPAFAGRFFTNAPPGKPNRKAKELSLGVEGNFDFNLYYLMIFFFSERFLLLKNIF